jgi:polysaccharide pyruvyl transferase WcaK-like protein
MIHHVFANRSNIGDWLSATGIQQLLGGQEVREHLCDAPFVPATLTALAEASPDDLIVIGGGGLFMNYFEPFWESFLGAGGHVPFVVWGAGYCDHKRKPSRASQTLLKTIADRARLFVVRDELTHRQLAGRGHPAPVPCPSLAAVDHVATPAFGLLHVDNHSTVGADIYEIMEEQGRAFAVATDRTFRKTNNRIESGNRLALTETLDKYAASDLVISSALHGCILAVAMGRKVLAVSGDWKIEGFMEAVGLGDWVLGQEQTDLLPSYLERLPTQPDRRGFVLRARSDNAAIAARVLDLVPAKRRSDA